MMKRSGRRRRRLRAMQFLVLTVLLASGCATPESDPPPVEAGAQVYCLRGLWDVFSLGLDDLAAELRALGVDAVALGGPSWPELAGRVASYEANRPILSAPILVGHSFGADDAVRLAQALDDQGAPVRLLVLLDATSPPPIPANVDRCVHFYLPNTFGRLAPGSFPGNPVVAAPGNNHTEIVNRALTEDEFGSAVHGVDHFDIEESSLAHELIIAEILSALDPLAAAPGP